MPNTVAQCVSSMFCFWMKNNQRYSDKKERMTETLAKLDLCSLSTKCFFFFSQLWNNYFNLSVSFLTQSHLQLESFTEGKKHKIIDK